MPDGAAISGEAELLSRAALSSEPHFNTVREPDCFGNDSAGFN